MFDSTSRLVKVGDALSQLANVLLLPRHSETTSNESISGRSHRVGWRNAERFINWMFSPDHCAKAYANDVLRARDYIQDYDSKAV